MSNSLVRIFLTVGLALACLLLVYDIASTRPVNYLGGLIFLQILVAILWKYEERFFPFLVIVFLWSGMNLPLKSVGTSGRWFVLALGAVAGCVIYLKDRQYSLGLFHLMAFACLVTALVSSMVSSYPRVAMLKTGSLLLVFLYGTAGARVAVIGREEKFCSGLLRGCEVLVYVSAVAYFILHIPLYGNPNSLGVVMGVAATPILLWGILISEGTSVGKRRTTFAFVLSLSLLLSSYARAAIVAGAVSGVFLCIGLRRYRMLINSAGVALLAAVLVAAFLPIKAGNAEPGSHSFVSAFLYKGHESSGILASRKSPWQETSSVISRHPWFGSGFGTSMANPNAIRQFDSLTSAVGASREDGNSYLAIVEWVGLLGMVPFFLLVVLTIVNIGRVMTWMRRTGSPFSPAVPLAAVLAAGLVNAFFEDWLFAVGYYMCVFFWTLAFVLTHILPTTESMPARPVPTRSSRQWDGTCGIIVHGQ